MNDMSMQKDDAKVWTNALDALFAPFNRSDAPGLVVGVAYGGRIIYRRGFGMASLEQSTANTPATRMSLGSSAKHFTSLAAMLLAEDGLLDIDASVRKYLPALPTLRAEPTLRRLMTHTGGYRDYLDLSFLCDGLAMKPRGYALAVELRQTEANFQPGERMLYCNGGYHLLATIVERVSGLEFGEFLHKRIFAPLGMTNTEAAQSDLEIHIGAATPHVSTPSGGYRRGVFPSEESKGDGAVISTVDDVLRWLAHMRGPHAVGTQDTWRQMFEHARLNNGSVVQYGLGLVRSMYRGVETIHHSGGIIGGSSQVLTIPGHALDIVIMSNGAPGVNPTELVNTIVDLVLGDDVLQPHRRVTHAKSSDYPGLVGRAYHSTSGFLISFGDQDGVLAFSMLGNYLMPLTATADELRLEYEDSGIGPFAVRVSAADATWGVPESLEISECGNFEQFRLVPSAVSPSIDTSGALVGAYRSPDMAADAEIYAESGELRMRVSDGFGTSISALAPLKPDLFTWKMQPPMLPIPGALNVETDCDRITGFRLDAARTRHVRFERVGASVVQRETGGGQS
jgi:D-aminopeptidase